MCSKMENRDVLYLLAVIVVCILKIFFYVTILLSNNWAEGNGSNFGVLKYCAHNETSCQQVTDKLQVIKVQLNTTLAFICISIILSSAWLIISLVFCRKRLRKEMKGHKIIHICTAMLLVLIEAATMIAFAAGIDNLNDVYSLGWTFYCAVPLPVLTLCFWFLFRKSTIESRRVCCWKSSAVEDSSDTLNEESAGNRRSCSQGNPQIRETQESAGNQESHNPRSPQGVNAENDGNQQCPVLSDPQRSELGDIRQRIRDNEEPRFIVENSPLEAPIKKYLKKQFPKKIFLNEPDMELEAKAILLIQQLGFTYSRQEILRSINKYASDIYVSFQHKIESKLLSTKKDAGVLCIQDLGRYLFKKFTPEVEQTTLVLRAFCHKKKLLQKQKRLAEPYSGDFWSDFKVYRAKVEDDEDPLKWDRIRRREERRIDRYVNTDPT
ncbi:uncharacterized protein LOC111100031 isoform X2 [Crassostrea virginica]